MSIITKKIKEVTCNKCYGTGKLLKINGIRPVCPDCNGTGIYDEYYSYFIDDKNKIAFSGEPGQ